MSCALTGLLGAGPERDRAALIGGDLRADGRHDRPGTGKALILRTPHDAVQGAHLLLTEERKHESILPNRPLRENIAVASLAAHARRGPRHRRCAQPSGRAVAGEVRDFGVVAASIDVPMRTLSGGNQQKALMARWHLADADVFVLVEPTRGVDVGARADIYRRLDALARAGKAIVARLERPAPRCWRWPTASSSSATAPSPPSRRPADLNEEHLNLMIQGAAAA